MCFSSVNSATKISVTILFSLFLCWGDERWVFAHKIVAVCIACITARKTRKHTYLDTGCNGIILWNQWNIIFFCKSLITVIQKNNQWKCVIIAFTVSKTRCALFSWQLLCRYLINNRQIQIRRNNQNFTQKYVIYWSVTPSHTVPMYLCFRAWSLLLLEMHLRAKTQRNCLLQAFLLTLKCKWEDTRGTQLTWIYVQLKQREAEIAMQIKKQKKRNKTNLRIVSIQINNERMYFQQTKHI